MSVNLIVTQSQVFNQFNNGIDFDTNLSDFTFNLTGNVMEKVKIAQKINISWISTSSLANRFDVDAINKTVTRTTGSWITEGFGVGETFDFINEYSIDPTIVLWSGQIAAISDLVLVYTVTFGVPVSTTEGYGDAATRGTSALDGLIYKFGLIGNSETFNINSKISGSDQAYYKSGITSGFTDMDILDNDIIDWVTGSAQVKRNTSPDIYTQQFEIEHIFIINPWFLEGELVNLQTNVIPSLLAGVDSIKYAYEPEFRSTLSLPLSAKSAVIENNPGSVGYLNRNFNNFNNFYEVVSIDYEDSGTADPANALLVGSKTKATIEISKIGGSFTSGQRIGAFISMLPTQSEYTGTPSNVITNFLWDNIYFAESAANTGSGVLKSGAATLSGGNLIIEIEAEYTFAQQLRLSGERYYIIGIQVADATLSAAVSDKVMLLGAVSQYDLSADIPDLMFFDKMTIFQHDMDIATDAGFTSWEGWIEDGVLIDFDFRIDLDKSAVVNTLDFKVSAFNTVTGDSFDLDSYSYPISGAIVSGGVQQFEVDTTRGYFLVEGDQFNFVKITTGVLDANFQHYTGQLGVKIPWQDWQQLLAADPIFYDNAEPNNNLNLKTSNYSGLNNYVIKVIALANVGGVNFLGQSGNTDYQFLSPDITINDYDLPGTWTAVKETFRYSNGADLGGKILTNEDTLFKITWTRVPGDPTDITDYWAIHRIYNELGMLIEEISTIRPFPTNSILQPITGDTQLNMLLVAGKVETMCLIKGLGETYTASGRISNGIPAPLEIGSKITEAGIPKDTEAGVQKIIE